MSKESFLQKDLNFMAEPFAEEDREGSTASTLANQEPFKEGSRRYTFDIDSEISLSTQKPWSSHSTPANKKLKLEEPRPSVSLCL